MTTAVVGVPVVGTTNPSTGNTVFETLQTAIQNTINAGMSVDEFFANLAAAAGAYVGEVFVSLADAFPELAVPFVAGYGVLGGAPDFAQGTLSGFEEGAFGVVGGIGGGALGGAIGGEAIDPFGGGVAGAVIGALAGRPFGSQIAQFGESLPYFGSSPAASFSAPGGFPNLSVGGFGSSFPSDILANNASYGGSFGNSFMSSAFGSSSYGASFGSSFISNVFGNNSSSDGFGSSFTSSILANNSSSNGFGSSFG